MGRSDTNDTVSVNARKLSRKIRPTVTRTMSTSSAERALEQYITCMIHITNILRDHQSVSLHRYPYRSGFLVLVARWSPCSLPMATL